MLNPQILNNSAYPMDKMDFEPNKFHRTLFVGCYMLAKAGCGDISAVEIENVCKNYEAQMELLEDNRYGEFIETVKSLASLDNWDYNYTTIRKMSLLRELKSQGIDISKYYNEDEDELTAKARLDSVTIQDILSDIETKGSKLRTKYDTKYVRNEIKAGENTEEMLEKFKVQPSFGSFLQSDYLSTLYNGWSRGHLICRAGNSGSGKSRCSVADLCSVGATYLWDEEEQEFVKNDNYQSPTLFIATEQELETEVQPMFYSAISGVEYRKITNGTTTKAEDARVLKAGEILQQSNITLTSMPRFTKQSLERKIKEKVDGEGIQYCCFDYMEVTADLSIEYKQQNATVPRQDLILLDLTAALKIMAEDYNVGIITGQQLNDSWKQLSFIDETALAGSKATKFKLDAGSIIVPTMYLKKDMKILESKFAAKRKGFGNDRLPEPNICEFIFKSRYGTLGDKRLKLWTYFDKGTFRRYDYFVTDDSNEIVKVDITRERDF